jgi:uncharacterized membrane protein YcaP (DUF421 family)
MDPLRIAVRAALTFVFLLALMRTAGKRAIRHGTTFDVVLAMVIGDLVDDALWSEVPMAQFIVAASTLVLTKLSLTFYKVQGVINRA